jgi:hypothetical protein
MALAKWFKRCPDMRAFKRAKLMGELAQVDYLETYFSAKEYDPQTQWWEHAAKMQQLENLKQERTTLETQLEKI